MESGPGSQAYGGLLADRTTGKTAATITYVSLMEPKGTQELESSESCASSASLDSYLEYIEDRRVDPRLEKFWQMVEKKSHQIPLSGVDREKLERITLDYFSELSKTLSREHTQSEGNSEEDEQELECEVHDVLENDDDDDAAKALDRFMLQARKSERRETSSSTDSESVSNSNERKESRGNKFQAYLPENEWVSNKKSTEFKVIAETFAEFLDNGSECFEAMDREKFCSFFMRLLVYCYEFARLEAKKHDHNEKVDRYSNILEGLKSISAISASMRILYDVLNDLCALHGGTGSIRTEVQELHAYIDDNAASNANEWIFSDLFVIQSAHYFDGIAKRVPLGENELQLAFMECSICCLENEICLKRPCCQSMACLECMKRYIMDKVNRRMIPVSCASCSELITTDEIVAILGNMSHRFYEILSDMNKNSNQKTCPKCNMITDQPKKLKENKRLGGRLINCERCSFSWCYRCHGPLHPGLSCRNNLSGKHQVLEWSKKLVDKNSEMLRNARQCSSCKMLIEKTDGCNHMTCNNCHHEFCYICGKNWKAGNIVFGKHSSRFSIFGCKKKLLPNRPLLRKLVRGSLFVLETLGIVVGTPIALALIIGLSPLLGIAGIAYVIYRLSR